MVVEPRDNQKPWIDSNGYLRLRTGTVHHTLDVVEHSFRVAVALTVDGQIPWIVDAREMTGADPRAWVVITEKLTSVASALAIIVSEATPSTLHGWQQRFDALLIPCRAFADDESATAWLETLDL